MKPPRVVAKNEGAATAAAAQGVVEFENHRVSRFAMSDSEHGLTMLRLREDGAYQRLAAYDPPMRFLRGTLRLGGEVLPLIDMRLKLSPLEAVHSDLTTVAIVRIAGRLRALIVDRISNLEALRPDQVRLAFECGAGISQQYIRKMGWVPQRVLILVVLDNPLHDCAQPIVVPGQPVREARDDQRRPFACYRRLARVGSCKAFPHKAIPRPR